MKVCLLLFLEVRLCKIFDPHVVDTCLGIGLQTNRERWNVL
jgi:hypothetical protein